MTSYLRPVQTHKDKISSLKMNTKTMDLHYLLSVEVERHLKRSMVRLNVWAC